MIGQALVSSLPMSVGVALSPLPVAAVIVMLMTARASTNAPAFLLGWIVGILAVGGIVFVAPGLETSRGEPTTLAGLIRIALGLGLMLLALGQWSRRPARGAPVEVPAMLRRLETIGPIQASVTGGNVAVALRVAKRLGPDPTVVTVPVDSGMKYLST